VSGRRIAVTGATGFIGRHLSTSLLAGGDEVLAIVRPASPNQPPPDVTVVRADLEASALRRAFAGVEAVVHLAGVVSTAHDEEYAAVNVDGTREVAEAARAVGARLIHISSLAAAGPASAARPRSEDDLSAPVTLYGRSKLESERIVAGTAGLSWTILRPGLVYGPGDRAVLPLFRIAKRGILPLVGRPDAAFTFIYVSDVVGTIEAALSGHAESEIVFVGHPCPVTARQMLEGIRSAIGRPAVVIPIPLGVTWALSLVGEAIGAAIRRPFLLDRRRYTELSAEGFVCRVDRLRERLGVIAQVDLHDGLVATAAWYREMGWL
jgi:nucleoside-diphosphate-sugar epimerase